MTSVLTIVRLLLAALTLNAIGQQLLLHVGASYSALNFFSYFTNLSNLFAVFALLLSVSVRSSRHDGLRDVARYASTVNMAIVGIVFITLLRKVDLGDLLPWVNTVLHYVMPVAVVLDWLIQPTASKLHTKHLVGVLLFPAIYLIYVLMRGASVSWYPYPFLDPANVGGYSGVALYSAGIFVTFLVVGGLLLVVGNRRAGVASERVRAI
jgi:hypothetical protein